MQIIKFLVRKPLKPHSLLFTMICEKWGLAVYW
jgi:hypothetical protein